MKLFLPLLFLGYTLQLYAQKPTKINPIQPFGKVDIADLELKTCDFESDANAMVLFPELHEFYKKMQELLNEQIVLKKS